MKKKRLFVPLTLIDLAVVGAGAARAATISFPQEPFKHRRRGLGEH
jgi:hypothetical protein